MKAIAIFTLIAASLGLVACGSKKEPIPGSCSDQFLAEYNAVNQAARIMNSEANATPVNEIKLTQSIHATHDACVRLFANQAGVSCKGALVSDTGTVRDFSAQDKKVGCDLVARLSPNRTR